MVDRTDPAQTTFRPFETHGRTRRAILYGAGLVAAPAAAASAGQHVGANLPRVLSPDDMRANGESDAVAIQKAVDAAAQRGGGSVQLLSRTYEIGTTIDMSGRHNVRLLGEGATNSGHAATTLKWTGAVGRPILFCDHTEQTNGCGIAGLAFNGDSKASRGLDIRGVVDWRLERLWLYGSREHDWFIDVGRGGNSQGLYVQSVSIDPYIFERRRGSLPASNGLWIGDGALNNDTCMSEFDDLQIQFIDGIGFRGGSADSNIFTALKIYRFERTPGRLGGHGRPGTGTALLACAGTHADGFQRWFQSNIFVDLEVRALGDPNQDKTNLIKVETGVRDPRNNRFGMLDQSGTEYPAFAGTTVLQNDIASETGYGLTKGLVRNDRSGGITWGRNRELSPGVKFLFSAETTSTGDLFEIENVDAPTGQRKKRLSVDPAGSVVLSRRNDDGSFGGTLLVITSQGHLKLELGDFPNDAAAAAGGVPVGGLYRNGSAAMVRTG